MYSTTVGWYHPKCEWNESIAFRIVLLPFCLTLDQEQTGSEILTHRPIFILKAPIISQINLILQNNNHKKYELDRHLGIKLDRPI